LFGEENHVEAPEELSKKTKLFFAHAADSWTADYYAKVNDNVFVNLGMYKDKQALLANYRDPLKIFSNSNAITCFWHLPTS